MRRALLLVALAVPLAASSGGAMARNDMVHGEVLVEFANSVSARTIDDLQRRHRLLSLERHRLRLAGTTLYRWRIADRRPVAQVVRELRREATVASAQPNYRFTLRGEHRLIGRKSAPAIEHSPRLRVEILPRATAKTIVTRDGARRFPPCPRR